MCKLLPDGSVIIVGGRASPSVEFYPAKSFGARHFPFLVETSDAQMDNLYPYVHLLPDGHLFIFANTRAVLYDYETGDVLREYPPLKGAPRSYPSAGSSAMLAITGNGGHTQAAEVVVCGGAGRYGVFIEKARDEPAAASCGRITATDPHALWAMEDMPGGRVMGDMVMLPTGDVIIINGASAGSQGFEMATEPCLHPYLYRANEPAGLRFMVLNPTTVPRMYHSTANLLPDGRVLVAGSNPHHFYKVGPGVRFPTELRVEAFSPEYLSLDRTNLRPEIVAAPERVGYGSGFELEVEVELPVVGILEVNLASAPFSTHSFSQGQRLVKLQVSPPVELTASWGHRYRIGCTAPLSANVAPPAYYMAFAVNQGVPSIATWIQVVPLE